MMEKLQKLGRHIKKEYFGMLFVMPVILGLLIFTFVPVGVSLVYSLHDVSRRGELENFGVQHYISMFTTNASFVWPKLWATVKYTIIVIPLTMVLSFSLAYVLNREMKGIKIARVLCYAPVVIPTVVSGIIWRRITESGDGYLNLLLEMLHLPPYDFFSNPDTALPSFIGMGLFGIGSGMILWLSQLKNIPRTLYESADLEGANEFQQLFCITIPMCTPTIFYTLITNVIGTLQVFDMAKIFSMPDNKPALDFFVLYIFEEGIELAHRGYGAALSWVLFAIIATLSAIMFKTSKWVYYGEDFN